MAQTGIMRFVSPSILLLPVALLLTFPSILNAQDDLPADSLESVVSTAMEQGLKALEDEEYDVARRAFSQAITAAPTFVDAYIGRARAFAGLEQPEDALADFTQAYTYTSSTTEEAKKLRAKTQFYRGKMYLDLGNQFIGTALPDLQAAYEADRDQLDYALQLGKAYVLAGSPKQGEPLLTDYLDENPDEPEALRLRSTAYLGLNKTQDALNDINRAIDKDSEDHESYLTLATIHITEEEYDSAIKALEKGIEKFEPEEDQEDIPFVQGYLTLAAVYEEMAKKEDDPEKAKATYASCIMRCDELLELLPEDNNFDVQRAAALFRKAISHRLLKEYGKAVTALTDALDLNPELGEAYYRRAICFAEMGEHKLALRDLIDCQTLNYGDARPYMWEGIVYAKMGEYRDAIGSYNKAISLSNRYSDAYLNRGHAYFQLGDYETAIDSFNECIRLNPSSAEFYFKRGLCYHNMEQLPQAIQSYVNAIQFNERYVPAYDQLIPVLESQGRTDMANRYREKRAAIDR